MLHLWLSTDRKQNTARMLTALCAEPGAQRRFLLVPDQFSHSMERLLCRYGGDQISRYAEVLGFSRLATRVFSAVGGCAERETDSVGRLLIMALAAEQVRSRLKLYGGSSQKPEFLLQILHTFDEFHAFCIRPEQLHRASAALGGALAVKTEELALLMESYDAVCANLGQNPQTRLERLLGALEDEPSFAAGKKFYFDGFTEFNGVEREILAQLLANGAEVSVNLHCDNLNGGAQQFESARRTGKALLALARKQQLPAEVHELPDETQGAAAYLRDRLFSGAPDAYPQMQEAVVFLSGADRVAECRAAAGEILRLAGQGARWRDISVACAEPAYRPILESVFRRAGIPAYFAGTTDILRQPVVYMLLAALEAACDSMERDTVLTYLKSGFLPITRERCDRLENYILLWNLNGSRLERVWEMDPYGLDHEADEYSKARLSELNEDRERLILPIARLRDRLKAAGKTAEMVLALERFLKEIALAKGLRRQAEKCSAQGALQQAQEYAQIGAILIDLMEQMYGVLGESRRSPADFFHMFRTALSQCSVGTIPASLDCVTVGDLMAQRRCDTKYVFLLGANEGSFPPAAANTASLLNDSERQDLLRFGIELSPDAAGRLDLSLAAIGSVLNAPEERLYLGAVAGREAYLYRRAEQLFPDAPHIADDRELIRRCEREYLSRLVRAPERGAADPALSARAQALAQAGAYRPGALREDTVEALYGKTLRLSSSKIELLASCRFAYFLQYGLKAEERKTVEIDTSFYGTFVHHILEQTVRQTQQEGGFAAVPLSRVTEIAQETMEQDAEKLLAKLPLSPRGEYLFRRNFDEIRMVVAELYRELSQSGFAPKWFELHFARDGNLPPIPIQGKQMHAELEGYVDRADVWQEGDRSFVRVVDYKTGKKAFEYSNILYGLGMQMLLYLFALKETGGQLQDQPLTPAGVLYFPARIDRLSIGDRSDEKKLESKRQQLQKRSGLLLDNESVLQAMEPCDGDPRYLPYRYDREGNRSGALASDGQFRQLERFVFQTVAELGDELYGGEIAPNPYFFDDKSNACLRCPYAAVCRDPEKRRLTKIKTAEEFWERMEEKNG